MPLYPFTCEECDHEFESLTLSSKAPAPSCPACESAKVARGLSVPAKPTAGRDLPATNCRGDGPPCALPQCGRRNL